MWRSRSATRWRRLTNSWSECAKPSRLDAWELAPTMERGRGGTVVERRGELSCRSDVRRVDGTLRDRWGDSVYCSCRANNAGATALRPSTAPLPVLFSSPAHGEVPPVGTATAAVQHQQQLTMSAGGHPVAAGTLVTTWSRQGTLSRQASERGAPGHRNMVATGVGVAFLSGHLEAVMPWVAVVTGLLLRQADLSCGVIVELGARRRWPFRREGPNGSAVLSESSRSWSGTPRSSWVFFPAQSSSSFSQYLTLCGPGTGGVLSVCVAIHVAVTTCRFYGVSDRGVLRTVAGKTSQQRQGAHRAEETGQ
ncbi:hypothetical protein Taro_047433 [Colocasia esculenta]|uniref:Uncharacterized protein n=1 Tax=Colocasia esculenta TaxID=4460 RepID=A0A843WVD3_COLES|nr:hypothetical protein [Colocasia esculenta]